MAAAVVDRLREAADPSRKQGMARVGIRVDRALGVSIPICVAIARSHCSDHELALDLWTTEIHEAPSSPRWSTTRRRSRDDRWTRGAEFDSWDLCDQVRNNLFRKATQATRQRARSPEEYVRRAAFTVVAAQAVHDRDRDTPTPCLATADPPSGDRRAQRREEGRQLSLRQIGKRNLALRDAAIVEAEALLDPTAAAPGGSPATLRELSSDAVARRFAVYE